MGGGGQEGCLPGNGMICSPVYPVSGYSPGDYGIINNNTNSNIIIIIIGRCPVEISYEQSHLQSASVSSSEMTKRSKESLLSSSNHCPKFNMKDSRENNDELVV